MDVSVSQMADMIFAGPPKRPCTFKLRSSSNLFQVLLSLTMAGADRLFGVTAPEAMSTEQYMQLQQYIQSVGFSIKYEKVYESGRVKNINVWFEPYIHPSDCHGVVRHT